MEEKKTVFSARNITTFAILLALVVMLQLFASVIKIGPTQFSLVLIPIVLASIIIGPWAGGLLGLVFGIIVYFTDPFALVLLQNDPVMTAVICFGKGFFAGFGAGLAYRLAVKKSMRSAVFVAAGAAPILNTGLFILGALFLSDVLRANFVADGESVMHFLIIGCAGVNFLVEFAVNMILSPALASVLSIVMKRKF